MQKRKSDGDWVAVGVMVIWVISALLSLAFAGVIIWALIAIVNWLVTK